MFEHGAEWKKRWKRQSERGLWESGLLSIVSTVSAVSTALNSLSAEPP